MNNKFNEKNTLKTQKIVGVLDQVAIAGKRCHRLALIAGFVLGGFVPVGTYVICHYEVQNHPMMWLIVSAGLVYSAITVFQYAQIAFKHPLKALGFCALLEGIMTFSETSWLSMSALGMLICVNGIACACQLVMDKREARRKK